MQLMNCLNLFNSYVVAQFLYFRIHQVVLKSHVKAIVVFIVLASEIFDHFGGCARARVLQ